MKYFITHGNFNWADEISMDGFDLWTEEELNLALKDFDKGGEYYGKTCNVYVGSNEDQDIESDDVLWELKSAEEITKDEYDAIMRVLGGSYGKTYYNQYDPERIDEDEDEDGEDDDED